MLPASGVARHADGAVTQHPGVADQAGPTVADHGGGLGDQGPELGVRQVGAPLGVARRAGRAVLDDDAHAGAPPAAPAVGEVHQPVERVVVGAREEEDRAVDGGAHSNGPTRRASG